MTREKMLEECVTPNEEVLEMCDKHYKDGYNKALEDYEAKIKECCSIVGSCDYEDMERIKEQLKR